MESSHEKTARTLAAAGALLVSLGIIIGAFGAHGLKDVLTERGKDVFEKAVLYHLINGVGICLLGVLHSVRLLSAKAALRISSLLGFGIVVFSGSLYLFAVTHVTTWAMITPVGGVAMILGWASTACVLFRERSGRV